MSSPEESFKAWDLPYVEDTRQVDDGKTNAFNRRSDWKYEPPEPEPEILPPTAEEIEAIRDAAHQEGLEQGKVEGYQQGLEQGKTEGLAQGLEEGRAQGLAEGQEESREEMQQHFSALQGLMQKLTQPVDQVQKTLETELVLLAVSLARSVIRTELNTNENIIFQALSEGLKVLPIQEERYQIHANPQDIALIKDHFSQEEMDKHHWVFIESPDMQRGGCDISTQSNAVDVTVERRVKEVLDRFLLDHGLDNESSSEEGVES